MQPVRVQTYDIENNKQVTDTVIDHDEHSHRVWLGKHCFWAMRNGHEVITRPTQDEITFKPRARMP